MTIAYRSDEMLRMVPLSRGEERLGFRSVVSLCLAELRR